MSKAGFSPIPNSHCEVLGLPIPLYCSKLIKKKMTHCHANQAFRTMCISVLGLVKVILKQRWEVWTPPAVWKKTSLYLSCQPPVVLQHLEVWKMYNFFRNLLKPTIHGSKCGWSLLTGCMQVDLVSTVYALPKIVCVHYRIQI